MPNAMVTSAAFPKRETPSMPTRLASTGDLPPNEAYPIARTAALRALERWRAEPDYMKGEIVPEPGAAALLAGEAGILLVAWLLTADAAHAERLHALVLANLENEAEDLTWGTPGTLVAAAAMRDWTGEERWRPPATSVSPVLGVPITVHCLHSDEWAEVTGLARVLLDGMPVNEPVDVVPATA